MLERLRAVPSSFTSCALNIYPIDYHGRISKMASICSQQPQTFWKKLISYLSVTVIIHKNDKNVK